MSGPIPTPGGLAAQARPAPDADLRSPEDLANRVRTLAIRREDRAAALQRHVRELDRLRRYLGVADRVTGALESLNQRLFEETLGLIEQKLSIALQEVLDQPLELEAKLEWKRNAASVEFFIERDGQREDIMSGQGGSVTNILSVGLRLFALTSLDEARHRRFLVLDEQDCWIRPDLVPALVKIVHDASRALGFQVLMISHHETAVFDRYADRIYTLVPSPEGVQVRRTDPRPAVADLGV